MPRTFITPLLLLLSMLLTAACSDDIVEQPPLLAKSVRVIYALDGLGDRSYSDGIYTGICTFQERYPDIAVEHYQPETTANAEGAIAEWFNPSVTPQRKNRLLVLTNDAYVSVLTAHPEWRIPDGDAVLLLDHQHPLEAPWQNVYTRFVSAYGAAHEGAMLMYYTGARHCGIVAANPVQVPVQDICQGFCDGFRTAGGSINPDTDIFYLGQGLLDGFAEADSLFRLSYRLHNDYEDKFDFIMPVCGGSILGILNFTRHEPGAFYTCGMDTDLQEYSNNVAFSIVKRMDWLIEDFLEEWLAGRQQPQSEVYGLHSRYMEIIVSYWFNKLFPDARYFIRHNEQTSVEHEQQFLNAQGQIR